VTGPKPSGPTHPGPTHPPKPRTAQTPGSADAAHSPSTGPGVNPDPPLQVGTAWVGHRHLGRLS